MTQINLFIGSIVQNATVQRAQAAKKDAHVRRAQNRAKDSSIGSDRFEHQVESSAALGPIHEGDARNPPHRERQARLRKPTASTPDASDEDGHAHIDLQA